jgi:hypothetical protein
LSYRNTFTVLHISIGTDFTVFGGRQPYMLPTSDVLTISIIQRCPYFRGVLHEYVMGEFVHVF